MEFCKHMLSLEELTYSVKPLLGDPDLPNITSQRMVLPTNLYRTLTKLAINICMIFDIEELPLNLIHFSGIGNFLNIPSRPPPPRTQPIFVKQDEDKDMAGDHQSRLPCFPTSLTALHFRFYRFLLAIIQHGRTPRCVLHCHEFSMAILCKLLPPSLRDLYIDCAAEPDQQPFMHLLPRQLTRLNIQTINLDPRVNFSHLPQSLVTLQSYSQLIHSIDDGSTVLMPPSLHFVQCNSTFNPLLWHNVRFVNPDVHIYRCMDVASPLQVLSSFVTTPTNTAPIGEGFEFSSNMVRSLDATGEQRLFQYLGDAPGLELKSLLSLHLVDDTLETVTLVRQVSNQTLLKRLHNLPLAAPNLSILNYDIVRSVLPVCIILSYMPASLTELSVGGCMAAHAGKRTFGELDLATSLPLLKSLRLFFVRGTEVIQFSKMIRTLPPLLTTLRLTGFEVCLCGLSTLLPACLEECVITSALMIMPSCDVLEATTYQKCSFDNIGSKSNDGWLLSIDALFSTESIFSDPFGVEKDNAQIQHGRSKIKWSVEELANIFLSTNTNLSRVSLKKYDGSEGVFREYYKRRPPQ